MNDTLHTRHDAAAPGAALARARNAQNLSIIEVARHLKLTPAQVEWLEAGEFDKLPGRVFVRGFIKNYAKLVRLDPALLLRQIESEIPKPTPVNEMRLEREVPLPVDKRSRWPVFAGIAFLIVAALAVYEFGFNDEHGRTNGGSESAPATASATEAPAVPVTPPAAPAPAPAPAPATSTPAPLPSVATAVPLTPAAPAVESERAPRGDLVDAQAMQSGQARPARAGEQELHFRFDDDSWVEIRDRDNKIIFSKLNRVGAEERVTGSPPLKLIVGNARKVQLTYNSRPVDLTPHISVTVARITLE